MWRVKSAADMKFNQAQKHAMPRTRATPRRRTACKSRARAGAPNNARLKAPLYQAFSHPSRAKHSLYNPARKALETTRKTSS